MFRRSLVLGVFVILSIGFSFAAKIDTTLFKETYQYDLKNLETDLKKDIDFKCDDLESCADEKKLPNNYQIKQADDTKVRQFIVALKTKKYQRAASVFNSIIRSWKTLQYDKDLLPSIYPTNYGRHHIGFIPYRDGVLWIASEGQVIDLKYIYITIKDNTLYRVKTNSSLGIEFENNTVIATDGDTGKSKFNLSVKNIETTTKNNWWYTEENRQKTYQRLFNYLQWKEKSKELDEWQNAFKAKIKKLFK
jgi:hypothetical protein